MSWISITCFVLNLFIILSCFRKDADVLSPARVFGFVWTLAIGLTDLKLSRLQHEWSLYSWLLTLLGIGAFFIGLFVVYTMNMNQPLLPVREVRRRILEEVQERLDVSRLFWITIFIFVAYCLAFLAEVAIEGHVPIFSPRIEKARVEFGVFGLHLIVNSMVTIMIVVVEYFLLIRRQQRRKFFLGAVFFLTAMSFFLLLQRYNYVVWAVMALGLTYYLSRHLKFRTVLIAGGVFFGFLSIIQTIRLSQYLQKYIYWVSQMKYSETYAAFTEPYMYIVMNLENFARAMEKLQYHTYGYFTADFLLALTGLKHWLEKYFHIVRLPYLVSGYNTFTFDWWYYYDFGIPGLAVFPFLLGIAITFLYYRMRREPTLLSVIYYSMGLVLMAISFMMNPLTRLDFVVNIFLLWVIHAFLIQKRAKQQLVEVAS